MANDGSYQIIFLKRFYWINYSYSDCHKIVTITILVRTTNNVKILCFYRIRHFTSDYGKASARRPENKTKLEDIMLPPLEPPLNLMSLIISVKFLRMSDTNILAGLEGIMGLEMLSGFLMKETLFTLIRSFVPWRRNDKEADWGQGPTLRGASMVSGTGTR